MMILLAAAGKTEIPITGIFMFIWLFLVILFLVAELITLGLTSIWFAIGALVAGISAMFGAPIWLQCVLFIVVTAVALASTRKLAKRFLEDRLEKTNAESLIGKTSTVIQTIDNLKETGKIRIGDIEWTARSMHDRQVIPKDTKVIIRRICGVKCLVEPVEEAEEPEVKSN